MERPAKKPRLLQGPDGFQKPKSTSTARYKPPESITKFVSAFIPPSPVKPVGQYRPVSLPTNPFAGSHVPREPDAGPSKPSVHRRQLKPSASTLPPLKVLKPPTFLPPAAPPPGIGAESSSKTSGVSLSSVLKRPPAPPEQPKSVLKPPAVPIPPGTKPSVPLKPLAPPPQLPAHRSTSPKKHMKTILTTSIAQATDPTKEGSGAELLSLFLQQHGHTFVSSTDRELQRGVMVSPDKRSRGKDPKFLRGGLAEFFHHHILCAKTDFTLWKRQMEQKIESGARFGSDMQLRILSVLDVVKVSERARFTAGPPSGLALCRLTRRHPLTSGDLTLGTYVVVFHFAPTNRGRSPMSSIDRFEGGNDVMVWLPWQKVELVGANGEGSARLLNMIQALDTFTPPHSLLVVSRFFIVAPRLLVDAK